MLNNKDTLLVALSDMHSGSTAALFPNRFWEGKNGLNHTPNARQELIYKHWRVFIDAVKQGRRGKRLVVVNVGDAIEGVHHSGNGIFTRDVNEQAEVHKELMREFVGGVDWQRGDALYYVRGTETHTLEAEHDIARELNAAQYPDGGYAADHFSITINGREAWFVHEGANAGRGANEGNGLRNWLRDIYFDTLKAREKPPDAIYSGHVHTPTYQIYVGNDNGDFRLLHGHVLPSWQAKTRYAYAVAPVAKNRIGGMMQVYTAGGDIRPPQFILSETASMVRV